MRLQLAPLDPMFAGLPHGVDGFRDARIISIAGLIVEACTASANSSAIPSKADM
jgi:hypothetical protein